ncbi:hypothetical protein Tco_0469430 [Tanacetum coccineum]
MMPSTSQEEIPPPPPPPPSSQTPTQQTPQKQILTITSLTHILKKGEYAVWTKEDRSTIYLALHDFPDYGGNSNEREEKRQGPTLLWPYIPDQKTSLLSFNKMTDAKKCWDASQSMFGGNRRIQEMQKLEIHGAGVSTEDANKKFLRSLPSAWSQVSLIMRTKPGVDTLSFDDLYNNLRVFESDIKGSTASSSSSPQNVAFVSENTNITNEVSTLGSIVFPIFMVKTQSMNKLHHTHFFANQSSCPQLDHEDLEQIDEYDLEKWTEVESAMILNG